MRVTLSELTCEGVQCACPVCGKRITLPRPGKAQHVCRGRELTALQKAKNFAMASVTHVKAGMPMASEEEVARRYAICQTCPFLKDGACVKCGCPVKRERKFLSKLSWANEECPAGKWGKAAGH